jgi:hypothetical protein
MRRKQTGSRKVATATSVLKNCVVKISEETDVQITVYCVQFDDDVDLDSWVHGSEEWAVSCAFLHIQATTMDPKEWPTKWA